MTNAPNKPSGSVPLRFVPVRPGMTGENGIRRGVFRNRMTPIATQLWWDALVPDVSVEEVDDGHTYISYAGDPLSARFRAEGATLAFSQYHRDMVAGERRHEVRGTEWFEGYPKPAYDGAYGGVCRSHLEITYDGQSDEVVVYYDLPTPTRQPGPDVPVYYRPAMPGAATVFNVQACPPGGRVVVDAEVGDGEVFVRSTLEYSNQLDWHDNWTYAGGYLTGPYLQCEGGTVELLANDAGEGWRGESSNGRFAVTHDGASEFILVTYCTKEPPRMFLMDDFVAIRYRPVGLGMNAKFDANRCPKDGRVVVNGQLYTNSGGNVFTGGGNRVVASSADHGVSIVSDLAGPYLTCEGGTVERLRDDDGEGWSGDMSSGRFAVTHDGVSDEIVVAFATRPD